jgi:hypothetical protein
MGAAPVEAQGTFLVPTANSSRTAEGPQRQATLARGSQQKINSLPTHGSNATLRRYGRTPRN